MNIPFLWELCNSFMSLLCESDFLRFCAWMSINKINRCDEIFSCIAWCIQMMSKKNTLCLMSEDARGAHAMKLCLLSTRAGRGKGLPKHPDLGLRLLPLQELNWGYAGTRQLSFGVREQAASSPNSCLWRQQCTVQETQPEKCLFDLYAWISFGNLTAQIVLNWWMTMKRFLRSGVWWGEISYVY